MKLAEITLNEIQFYVSRQVDLHPVVYASFLKQLVELQHKEKLCLTPRAIFEQHQRKYEKTGT